MWQAVCSVNHRLYICEQDTAAVLSDIRSPDTCAVRTERQTEWKGSQDGL